VHQLLVTRVGKRYAGWVTGDLAEIVSMPKLFPLPSPLPHLAGTVFMRGRLVSVVDTHSLMGEPREQPPPGLLARLAPPLGHLALSLASIEAVLPYEVLNLREEEAEGIWAGLYPWEDVWVNVVRPKAVAEEIGRHVASSIRYQTPVAGREHAP